MDETTITPATELNRVATRLERRANSICCCFRSQTPVDDRRALAQFMRLLRQRAAVLRKWQRFAMEGADLPLNWRAEMAEAENLAD